MRKNLFFLFLSLLTFSTATAAKYEVTNSQGVVITYTPNNYGYGSNLVASLEKNKDFAGDLIIPNQIEIDFGYATGPVTFYVVGFESGAFVNCPNLTGVKYTRHKDISIENTELHSGAFVGCTSLNSVDFLSEFRTVSARCFSGCTALTDVTIPSNIRNIGTNAFENCTNLTSVTLPPELEYIGEQAFTNCTSLKSITIPDAVTSIGQEAFLNCSALQEVTFGCPAFNIGHYAFRGCENLKKVTIGDLAAWTQLDFGSETSNPLYYAHHLYRNENEIKGELTIPSVEKIGEKTFINLTEITSLTIPESVNTYNGGAFTDCTNLQTVNYNAIALPLDQVAYSKGFFKNCSNLTTLNIGENVTTIPDGFFKDCTGITSLTIPNKVTDLGDDAFKNCTNLTSVTLGNSLTTIHFSVFQGCTSLTSLTLPNSVKTIKSSAFMGCTALESITLPNSITEIGSHAFHNCSSLTGLVLPNALPAINDYTFYECSSLNSLTIPSTVASVGASAFVGCSSLTAIDIPNSVASIGANAFDGLSKLTTVTFGNSLATIGKQAFHDCGGLTQLTFPASLSKIGNEAFYGCSGLKKLSISSLEAWCNITFDGYYSNPMAIEDCKLYLNGELLQNLAIPITIATVKPYAFLNCDQLTSLSLPGSVTQILNDAFRGCSGIAGQLVFPDALTLIGSCAFYNCGGITSVTVPNNMTDIYDYVFYNCENLKTVYNYSNLIFEKGSTSYGYIAYYADEVYNIDGKQDGFTYQRNGKEVTLLSYDGAETVVAVAKTYNAKPVTAIAPRCFLNNATIQQVIIPPSVTAIGESAFQGCTALTSVNFQEGLTSIGISAFKGCTSITSLVLPNSLTFLGDYAFNGNTSLQTLKFGSALDEIRSYSFEGCTSLTDVVLPPEISIIGASAFQGCSSITKLNIGCNIRSINYLAFEGVNSLVAVNIATESAPTIDPGTFTVTGIPLYVPEGSIELYTEGRGNPWANFDVQAMKKITALSVKEAATLDAVSSETPIALTPEIEPADATLPHIFWQSSDPEMATIDAEGHLVISSKISDASVVHKSPAKECVITAKTMYADGPIFEITLKGNVINLETIGATGYQTLYYSDRDLLVPEGISAWVFLLDPIEGLVAKKSYPAGSVIPAGEAVALFSVTPGEYSFKVSSTVEPPVSGNLLHGTDEKQEVTTTGIPYILAKGSSGVGFYQAASGGAKTFTNGAHKAYLELPEGSSSIACVPLDFGAEEEETTLLNCIMAAEADANAPSYNVLGQPVGSDYKGFVIKNGKKYINK